MLGTHSSSLGQSKVYISCVIKINKLEERPVMVAGGVKVKYGLKSSTTRWFDALVQYLRILGFEISPVDETLIYNPRTTCEDYDFILSLLDDLLIEMEEPEPILECGGKQFGMNGEKSHQTYLGPDCEVLKMVLDGL